MGLFAFDMLFKTYVAPAGGAAPFAFLGDDVPISIDSAAYDAATNTVTLGINGGVGLTVENYRLYARAGSSIKDILGSSLDGNGDGLSYDDFKRDFAVTTAPPHVTKVNSIPDSGDGTLAQNEVTSAPVTDLLVTFNEAVQDPAGDSDHDGVTNPDNYALVGSGPNTVFDAVPCNAFQPVCIQIHNALTIPTDNIVVLDGQLVKCSSLPSAGDLARISVKVHAIDSPNATLTIFDSGEDFSFYPFHVTGGTLIHTQSVTVLPGWNHFTLSTSCSKRMSRRRPSNCPSPSWATPFRSRSTASPTMTPRTPRRSR